VEKSLKIEAEGSKQDMKTLICKPIHIFPCIDLFPLAMRPLPLASHPLASPPFSSCHAAADGRERINLSQGERH